MPLPASSTPTDEVQRVPDLGTARDIKKVLLHDHLDGGVRLETLQEFADLDGYREPLDLTPKGPTLVDYLVPFGQVTTLVNSPERIFRVTTEALADLHADGVIHAEIRFAPALHATSTSLGAILEAATAALVHSPLSARIIVCALRSEQDSLDVARAALAFADHGVVAFDLAGNESYAASLHRPALDLVRSGLPITLHAAEARGPEAVAEALDLGASRLGHGIRILEAKDHNPALYDAARALPLEICPSSNVQTGAVLSLAQHPVSQLAADGFTVSINTDNRSISATTLSGELDLLVQHFALKKDELIALQHAALDAAFLSDHERRLLRSRLDPLLGTSGPKNT